MPAVFDKFACVDNWRESLITFIDNESGNFTLTDKTWLKNFYDYELYQAKLATAQED